MGTALQPTSSRDLGTELLHQTLGRLKASGYTQARVDTLRHPVTGIEIRHHYTGREWRLVVSTPAPDGPHDGIQPRVASETVRFTDRDGQLPTVDQLSVDVEGAYQRVLLHMETVDSVLGSETAATR